MVLTDNPKYTLGAPPKVKRVTVEFIPDDATRAQRLRAGKLDGAALAPTQAAQFAKSDAFTVFTDPSADIRAITLPESNPVAADPAVRLALNQAVNRAAMVSKALGGQGGPATTPIPSVLPEFVEPTATFDYDSAKATAQLYAAGWVAGTDGIRSRNGVTAELTLDYPAGDTTDAALAQDFAADAKAIGIKIDLAAVDPAQLTAKEGTDAVLISTGNPFDPDLTTYDLLDSVRVTRSATTTPTSTPRCKPAAPSSTPASAPSPTAPSSAPTSPTPRWSAWSRSATPTSCAPTGPATSR